MRRTKEDALATKGKVLDAALKIFIKKGYSQTTLEDIVTSLRLTRGAFYWHFKDKDDLLAQLILREHTYIAKLVTNAVQEGATERDKLEKLMLNIVNSFYENKRYRDYVYFVRFAVEFNSASSYFKKLTGLNEFLIKEAQKILTSALKKGQLKTSIDPVSTSVYIISMLDGMFRLYFALPSYLSEQKQAKKIVTNYIEILFGK